MHYITTAWRNLRAARRSTSLSPHAAVSGALQFWLRLVIWGAVGYGIFVYGATPAHAVDIPVTTTIQAAINTASAGDTVIVPAGSYTESLYLSKAVSLTGALSSTTILYAMTGSKILTVTGASIDNSVIISGFTFANGVAALNSLTCPKFCAGALYVSGSAHPLFQNLIFTNNVAELGGAIYAESGSPLTLQNSYFYSNTADGHGGAIYANDLVFITGTTFMSNTASNSNGGALNNALTSTISSSTFISNVAGGKGGGAYVIGNLYVDDSLIEHNSTITSTPNPGGGLWVQGSLVVTNSTFYSNTSWAAGAAASVAGNLTMVNCQVLTNTAVRDAGGLDVTGGATISNSYFFGNIATHASIAVVGGALRVSGNAIITDSQFVSNSAVTAGGAINVTGDITITDTYFERNQSTGNAGTGGALNASGRATLYSTSFLSNTAGKNGGAVTAVSSLAATDSQFVNNIARIDEGGALYVGSFGAVITNSEFRQNRAVNSGGAIRMLGSIVLNGGLLYDNSCSAASCTGGGVYVSSGRLDVDGTQIISNTARKGGGMWVSSGSATVNNALFERNIAAEVGALSIGQSLVMSNSQIVSNTATGGSNPGGGAIYVGVGASVYNSVFVNNIERGNTRKGGALYVANNSLFVVNSRFISNTATSGGAIYHLGADAYLTNTLLARNTATGTVGMAVFFAGSGRASLVHTTIASPTLAAGSAVHVNAGSFTGTNNIIMNHSVAINEIAPGLVQEDYNLFYSNTTNFVGGILSYGHTLFGNPAFVNMAADDYHILPTSLALDRAFTGTNILVDFEGDARPQRWGPDMGADESPEPIVVDLAITKTASAATVLPGQPITYRISYLNQGPQPHGPHVVPDVIITDIVPSEVLNLMAIRNGLPLSRTNGVTYSWTISNIWPGQGGFITITGMIDTRVATPTLINNTAIITSMFDTVTMTNNSSAAPVLVQPPEISIGDAAAAEGDAGTHNLLFPVTLSTANPYAPAYVNFASSDDTALAGVDYVASSGTITFSAGQTSQMITVTINGDIDTEVTETLRITLSNSIGAIISDSEAVGSILNDDVVILGLQAQSSAPTTLGQTTYFTASAATGGVTYEWNFGDNSPASAGALGNHIYASAGLYTAIMTVSNGFGIQVLTMPVTITNLAPVAKAGEDLSMYVGAVATLDGRTSSDPDGHMPLSYEWTQIGGPVVVFGTPTFSRTWFVVPAYNTVLTFSLMVTDSYGLAAIAADQMVIHVGELPITGLTMLKDNPTIIGNSTHFTGVLGAGSNVEFQWNFGDGTQATGINASHTYALRGNYVVTLTAKNPAESRLVTGTVAVVDEQIAGISLQGPLTATTGMTGTYMVSATGGTNLVYSWTVNGQPAGTGPQITWPFDEPGTYTVTVTVSNGSSTITRTLEVIVPRDEFPVYLPVLES